jgi:hypothetical protein
VENSVILKLRELFMEFAEQHRKASRPVEAAKLRRAA